MRVYIEPQEQDEEEYLIDCLDEKAEPPEWTLGFPEEYWEEVY